MLTPSRGGTAREQPDRFAAFSTPPTSDLVAKMFRQRVESSHGSEGDDMRAVTGADGAGEIKTPACLSLRAPPDAAECSRRTEADLQFLQRVTLCLRKGQAVLLEERAALAQRERLAKRKISIEQRQLHQLDNQFEAKKSEELCKLQRERRHSERLIAKANIAAKEDKLQIASLQQKVDALEAAAKQRVSKVSMTETRLRQQVEKLQAQNREHEADLYLHEQQRLQCWGEADLFLHEQQRLLETGKHSR